MNHSTPHSALDLRGTQNYMGIVQRSFTKSVVMLCESCETLFFVVLKVRIVYSFSFFL